VCRDRQEPPCKGGDVTLEIAIALTTAVLGVIADCDSYGAFCHAPLEADKADTTLRSLLSGLFFPAFRARSHASFRSRSAIEDVWGEEEALVSRGVLKYSCTRRTASANCAGFIAAFTLLFIRVSSSIAAQNHM
jgi:hypothetical protein